VTKPQLRSISPEATPDEVAAIVAAVSEVARRRVQQASAHAPARSPWVTMTRLSARRTGAIRGPWRLSGRLTRRSRA